jgi:hypothetical protein
VFLDTDVMISYLGGAVNKAFWCSAAQMTVIFSLDADLRVSTDQALWSGEVKSCHDRANAAALEALNNLAKHNTCGQLLVTAVACM